MNKILLILLITLSVNCSFGQVNDSAANQIKDTSQPFVKEDSPKVKKHKLIKKVKPKLDSISRMPDSLLSKKTDSSNTIISKPIVQVPKTDLNYFPHPNIFLNNNWLNLSLKPVYRINAVHKWKKKELVFYIISFFLLLFGLFKVFYSRYFHNVFKVFFNTSLRQNQLTDILLQARLASLIFNIIFILNVGLYLWQIFIYKEYFSEDKLLMLPVCIGVVLVIYCCKYLVIKFMGWITTFKTAANQYIFVIFLINKMIGVFLIPFIILLAFGPASWNSTLVLLSFLLIGTLFLLRYLRTYGLLQKQLSLNLFHFLLYLIGIEILPLVALYHFLALYSAFTDKLFN